MIAGEVAPPGVFLQAAEVLDRHDWPDPLSAPRCRRLHERWWIDQTRLSARTA